MRKPWMWSVIGLLVLMFGYFVYHQHSMAPLARYQQRFDAILPVIDPAPQEQSDSEHRAALPQPRELLFEPKSLSISLADLFTLDGCALQQAVIEHNGALGKVATGFGRLQYEYEFLRLAPDCLTWLHAELERAGEADRNDIMAMIDAVESAMEHKRRGYWATYWNATFAGDEFRRYVSTSNIASHIELNAQFLALLDPIVKAITTNKMTPPPSTDLLQHWYFSQDVGEWIAQERAVIHQLGAMRARLKNQWTPSRLCPQGRPTRRSRELLQLVKGVLVGQLQPQWVEYRRFGDAWVEVTRPLLAHTNARLPDAFTRWLTHVHETHLAFIRSIKAHVQLLSATFQTCGLSLN